LHLSRLIDKPKELNQFENRSRSDWSFVQSSGVFMRRYNLMSSAKQSNWQFCSSWLRLFINNEYNIGDRWLPWGTPEGARNKVDLTSKTLTHRYLLLRKDLNQDRRGSPNPDSLSICISTLWLTESKARYIDGK